MILAPPTFSLRQLQYAVAVAESMSFRKAAERCHVSQPSLSAQLAQLEDALGVRLFERDRRRVLLTTAGKELVERARRVLLDVDDLLSSARHQSDPLVGQLNIGVIPTISPYLLPEVAPAIRAGFPRLTVLWTEDKTDVLVRSLDTGLLDAALLALEADIGDVEREVIACDEFVLATPPGHHLAAGRSPVALSDLRGESLLLLDDGHCLRQQALAFCSSARVRELEFRATSLSTLVQMVAADAGITLLPRLAVATEVRRAELRLRPFAAPAPHRTIALVWRRQAARVQALRRVAATILAAYPRDASASKLPAGKPGRKRAGAAAK
jgi:LysR family hydrogen peroxide-inducible transcriptional activator